MPKKESFLYLKALKEDGIEHVYVQKRSDLSPAADGKVSQKEILRHKSAQDDAGVKTTQAGKVSAPPPVILSPKDEESQTKTARGDIDVLRAKIEKCKLCGELAKTRNKTVFGAGSMQAKVVFVGEAPGADEDEQGLPFVGRAGQLLTKIIEAMGMTRDQVFICNVLKCRPPNNRPPAPEEVVHCRPYLKQQLEIIKPKVIVALGSHAAKTLLQTEQGISELRGTFQKYEGIPVMCTYHPAYLLRSPGEKRKVWEDMKKVMKLLAGAEE